MPTIEELQNEIIAAKDNEPELSGLTSNSPVAIWQLWTYVFGVSSWNLQKKHDLHKQEVAGIISAGKAHTANWYAEMALKFQYGHTLVQDKDYYDNTGLSQAAIDAAKIVKYAVAKEVRKGVMLKVAKVVAGELAPLSTPELNAFVAYMNRVKDAGIFIYPKNAPADSFKLEIDIFYDPLVLDSTGARLDGTSATPVKDAINAYLKNLRFNGTYVNEFLIDALQKVDGVKIPHLVSAEAKYALFPFAPIDVEYVPDSGYLRFDNPTDLTINYYAHAF